MKLPSDETFQIRKAELETEEKKLAGYWKRLASDAHLYISNYMAYKSFVVIDIDYYGEKLIQLLWKDMKLCVFDDGSTEVIELLDLLDEGLIDIAAYLQEKEEQNN